MGITSLDRRAGPPYLPFKTFLNFLDMLVNTIVPTRIDSSIMSKYPGSIKAQLRGALSFIGAINDQGDVQPAFKALVKARAGSPDEWRLTFSDQFFEWYSEVIRPIDLDSASLAQLKDCFEAAGCEGSVIIKATRFFLAGLDEAGSTYSPHFKQRGALSGGNAPPKTRARKSKAKAGPDIIYARTGESLGIPTAIPEGFDRLALPLPNRSGMAGLTLPADLNAVEWRMIDTYVRSYFDIK